MINLLEQFFKDISTIKPLTRQEEIDLATKLQKCELCNNCSLENRCDECRKVINLLVMRNLPLVVRVAQRYRRNEFLLEDLVGFGISGLFRATIKYDPTKNVPFASYAGMWIKDFILKAIRTCGTSPKIPLYANRKLYQIARAKSELAGKGLESTPELIAERTDLSADDIESLSVVLRKWVPLDELEDFIDTRPTPEQELIEKERNQLIFDELNRLLTEDQLQVICYYFGLLEYPQLPLTAIADKKNVSMHVVTVMKNKALEVLKASSLMRLLHEEV